MKFQMKKLVVALALAAAAGQAGAAMIQANSGNGDMFLTVWDTNNTVSYSRDLGVGLGSFLPNSVTGGTMTPEAGVTQTFATDALFNTAFGGINQSTDALVWNVVAGDSTISGFNKLYTPGQIRVLTTSNSATPTILTNSGNNTAATNINSFQSALNTTFGCGAANSCMNNAVGNVGFGGSNGWDSLGTGSISTTGTAGQALNFWYITGSGTSTSAVATQILYQNSQNMGTMTMDASGNVTYSLAPAVSAVPVPAAVWLFGSGLLGLVGIARRKRA